MPKLAVMSRSTPGIFRLRIDVRMRSARRTAPVRSVSGRKSTNSSPPLRPAKSLSRITSFRRVENAARTSSPRSWP
jgi:hypothetical protein